MGAAVKRLYKHKLNLVENLDELADHAVVKVRTKRSYMSKQTAIGSNSELTEADNNLGMKQPNSKRIISNVNRKNDKSDSVVFATGKKQHHKGKQVSAASDVGGCDLRTVKNSLERSTKEEIKEKRPYKKRSYFSPFEPRQLRKRQKFNYKETQPYSSSFRLTCSEISAKNLPCEKAMDAAKSGPPVNILLYLYHTILYHTVAYHTILYLVNKHPSLPFVLRYIYRSEAKKVTET